ncbi:MAG TPA: tetratricopeptide repeat protein [Burkholderiales bacterium]|nr:tetratricopeptide repeat protein [Burkholderiales bacterium]
MQSKDFRSPAQRAEPPRQRLTSPWTLVGITVAVVITLVLIFPGRGILTSETQVGARSRTVHAPAAAGDPVLAQLQAQTRKEPTNPQPRFALAQKHVELGSIKDARAALEPLYNSPDPAVRQRARLEDFKLQIQEMYAIQPGTPQRARETERLRQELAAMAQYQWDSAGLRELTDLAAKVEARKLRASLFLRIVKSDESLVRAQVDEAGKQVLSDGEYLTAAELYFAAQQRAASLDDRRHYFRQAIASYHAGNMTREALLAADAHMGALANDDQTLKYMIKLARAANDMKRAQLYAKRLLRMSARGTLLRWLETLASIVVPPAMAADGEPAARTGPPAGMRPYDAESYQLAYEVFVANKNLEDAYRVARSAVLQVPNDMRWRENLAQVAEWTGRAGEALEQWSYIARRTNRGSAWQAVLRLAPGLFEDEVLLEALRYQAGTTADLTDDQWRAIATAYENVGRPREGIEFLEREYQRRPRPVILESLATLHERGGDLDRAIAAYQRLIQSAPNTERVTTLATLLITRGDFRAAYDVLERHRSTAPAEDTEYLRLLADLAWRLQDDTAAQVAYERLVAHPRAQADDFQRLIAILQPRQPEAAARLAESAYARFKEPSFLTAALGLYSSRRDFASMRRIITSLPPDVEAQLSKNPEFLLLRGEYRGATGSPRLALADFREALRLDPNNRFARLALIYLLIDLRDLDGLRKELPRAIQLAKDDPEFMGAVGSAFLALSDPQRGVVFYRERLKHTPDDYLWLLNYADALEQNNNPDMAWRVRRHAWIKLREEMAKKPPQRRPELELAQAQARVAMMSMRPDQTSEVMRHLLRLDSGAESTAPDPRRRGLDAASRDLVLAWTIQSSDYIAAKAWLWKAYGTRLAHPTWAETRIALEHNDVETLQRALEAPSAEAIPRYDRHQAARTVQAYRLAQTIAFDELEKQPHDDEMHLRLTQSVMDMHSHTQVGYTTFRRGVVGGHEWTGQVGVWLSPRLRLSFDVSHIDQGLITPGVFGMVPGNDRLYGVTALWRHGIGETTFSVFRRTALLDSTGFSLTHGRPFTNRISGRIGLGYNERATETTALSVGGMRDRAFLDVSYQLSKREYLFGQLYGSRFYTQDRHFIGSAYGLNWEAGHRFRTEYPDFHVRLAGSINHFDHGGSGDAATSVLTPTGAVPTAAFFLPGSFSVYGIYTGFGTFYQNNYTRAIRPFVDVGIARNTVTGTGYSALAGLSGSVIGTDRLTAYISTGRGGTGVNELSREIGLRYMYLFDSF